jgi:hypothetical protein
VIDVGIFQALLVYGASLVVATSTGFFHFAGGERSVSCEVHLQRTHGIVRQVSGGGGLQLRDGAGHGVACGILAGPSVDGKILSSLVIAIIGFFAANTGFLSKSFRNERQLHALRILQIVQQMLRLIN